MKISEIKAHLAVLKTIAFELPNGKLVPKHFHVTEVGKISKAYIDCGGTVRKEEFVNFQLWEAEDYNHRLHPEKLVSIIELSEKLFGLEDLDIEVEYQNETIGKYGLRFNGANFVLTNTLTDCLAKEKCTIPKETVLQTEQNEQTPNTSNSCAPGSGCC